jgi:hypothetical protein
VRVAGVNYDINSTDTSYDFTVSNGNVVFDANIANGVFFYILRDTLGIDHDDTALLYDFSDGSILTADQQDDVYRQNFYLAQEAMEQVPTYDSGWINSFDSGVALAANTTLQLTVPSHVGSSFPWADFEIWGKDGSNNWYPFSPNLNIYNDVIWVVESSNWKDVGLLAIFVTGSNRFNITTGDYAWSTEALTGSGSEREWVTDITHLRVIIRSK